MTIIEVLQEIQSKLNAPKGQYNKFGKYYYRNAEDILEAVKPLLEPYKAILIIHDNIVQVGDRYYVEATATLHYQEEEISAKAYAREDLTQKGMDAAQLTGSTSSYARKYALNGLLCIDDEKDPDSNEKKTATENKAKEQEKKQSKFVNNNEPSQPPSEPTEPCKCAFCGKEITGYTAKNGKTFTAEEAVKRLKGYCPECFRVQMAKNGN